MRKQGSCRFETYYRFQVYDETALFWRPHRGMFKSKAEAKKAAEAHGGKTRIEIVTEGGRKFV